MTILEMWEWSTHLHWQHQLWRHLSVSARVDEIQLLKCARRQYAWKPCKFKQCSMKWWRTRQLQRQPWSGRRCRTHKLHANKLRCICLQCVAWIPRNTKRIRLCMKVMSRRVTRPDLIESGALPRTAVLILATCIDLIMRALAALRAHHQLRYRNYHWAR